MGRPIGPCVSTDPIIQLIHKAVTDGSVQIGDLAKRSGVGHDTLRTWFKGEHRPVMFSVNAVLGALGYRLVAEAV